MKLTTTLQKKIGAAPAPEITSSTFTHPQRKLAGLIRDEEERREMRCEIIIKLDAVDNDFTAKKWSSSRDK